MLPNCDYTAIYSNIVQAVSTIALAIIAAYVSVKQGAIRNSRTRATDGPVARGGSVDDRGKGPQKSGSVVEPNKIEGGSE
jgi:hypothetical protein